MATTGGSQPREQWARTSDSHRTDFERAKSPLGYQLGAWALWVAGLAIALFAALAASDTLHVPVLSDLPVLTAVLAVVLDLVAVLTAQRLWKKAGSLRPGVRQGLVGVAMACLAFAPMALFFLAAKNASTATRIAAVAAAVVSVAAVVACCVAPFPFAV